jgi:hypothetical protein
MGHDEDMEGLLDLEEFFDKIHPLGEGRLVR